MILDLVNTCNDVALANLLAILKNILSLIQLVGPIIALVSLTIIFTKLMINPEGKNYTKLIKNCLLALVLMFFVPVFINALMLLFDDKFTLSACWNSAKFNSEVEFIEPESDKDKDDKKDNSFIIDPDSYEKGDTGSGSTNNRTSSGTGVSGDVDDFLNSLNYMSKEVKQEGNWKYSNKNNKNTFEKADSSTNSTNCALYVVWGLVDIGVLDSGDRFYKHKSNTIKYSGDAKAKMQSKMKYINGNGKTAKSLINNGTLKAGDIVLWYNQQHTNVYAGNSKWYDAGRQTGINGSGSSSNYKFKTLGPVKISYYMNGKVWKILRIK